MKKFIKIFVTILVISLLQSCSDDLNTHKSLISAKSIVLNKRFHPLNLDEIYIFDGESSDWYVVDAKFYNSIEIGDTLSSITIKIEREIVVNSQQVIN